MRMRNGNKIAGIGVAAAALVALVVVGHGIGRTNAQPADLQKKATDAIDRLLPNAKPGECYAKVLTPAQYKTVTEEVMTREASQKYEIVPAKYGWVEEKVLTQDASEKIVEVPAVFETEREKIEIRPARKVWRAGTRSDSPLADASLVAAAGALGLPSTAQEGQCFYEYVQSSQYKTEQAKVVKKPAYKRHDVVPAEFDWVEEKVVTKQASHKIIEEPAVYETVTEKVLETPATTTWKRGRGLVERVDNTTGEIMCLVEVPAKYKTVTKRVLKKPATTRKVEVPAEYKTVRRQKMVAPARVKEVEVPAEYAMVDKKVLVSPPKAEWRAKGSPGEGKASGRVLCRSEIPARYTTVTKQVLKTPATTRKTEVPAKHTSMRVLKVSSPAEQKLVEIPATTETITKRVKVADGKLEWRQVLCETNMTTDLVADIQRALSRAGFDPGPIDGVIGRQTLSAVNDYQQRKGLATGGLTWQTLEALGVKRGS